MVKQKPWKNRRMRLHIHGLIDNVKRYQMVRQAMIPPIIDKFIKPGT